MLSNVISISRQKEVAIINKYAQLQRELVALKTELEKAKVEVIELLGEGEHSTASAKITVKWIERNQLDQAKAKSFLPPAQLLAATGTVKFYDVRVKSL